MQCGASSQKLEALPSNHRGGDVGDDGDGGGAGDGDDGDGVDDGGGGDDGDGGDDDVGVGQVLHDIDSCCRKLFPSVFVILNLIYWTSYVYIL